MKCQFCENPASVHVTEVVNFKKRALHLCEDCARERNLLPKANGPQLDLKALLSLIANPFPDAVEDGDDAPAAAPPAPEVCPACGLTLAEFRAEGRLGCAHDYDALRAAIEPLLERVHRHTAHAGKAPRAVRAREWQKQMKAAIAAEDYEEAARLRDLIRCADSEQ
jgi:protein arginine kinase activator